MKISSETKNDASTLSLNILIVHEVFAPDFRGGGEVVMLETARHLAARGFGVQVLTTGDPFCREYEGISTIRLPISRYRFNFAVSQIVSAAQNADVILTATYHGCLPAFRAGALTGKPVVCLVLALFRKVWSEMRGALAGFFFERWERFLLTRTYARWIFISDYSRDVGVSMGIPGGKTTVAHPGITLENFIPVATKDNVVFVTGKLDPRKGIFDILNAARDLPDVRFRVMGWGPREAEIRRQAPPNVEFIPFERGRPLEEMFNRARIFLFPSKGETFGIALVEAMASGCAVISSVPLPFEGIRIAAGDGNQLRQAIRELWDDPGRCADLGARNHVLARQYSWTNYTDRIEACLHQVLRDGSAGNENCKR